MNFRTTSWISRLTKGPWHCRPLCLGVSAATTGAKIAKAVGFEQSKSIKLHGVLWFQLVPTLQGHSLFGGILAFHLTGWLWMSGSLEWFQRHNFYRQILEDRDEVIFKITGTISKIFRITLSYYRTETSIYQWTWRLSLVLYRKVHQGYWVFEGKPQPTEPENVIPLHIRSFCFSPFSLLT